MNLAELNEAAKAEGCVLVSFCWFKYNNMTSIVMKEFNTQKELDEIVKEFSEHCLELEMPVGGATYKVFPSTWERDIQLLGFVYDGTMVI